MELTRKKGLAREGAPNFTPARWTGTSASALVAPVALKSTEDNAWRSVLADEMEVRPLSLSRLQVLCHSLSKVLFKLSLTLLVRYRSSYSVFNFGRHIPADSHCTPKQCYSFGEIKCGTGFLAQWADTFYGSILT
jgi:hypothetical protein